VAGTAAVIGERAMTRRAKAGFLPARE